MREIVSSPREYFVAVNGDEANSGTSAGSPWPIRYAIKHVARNLDIQHARVTIRAACPPSGQGYPPIVLPNWFGNCDVDPGQVANGIPGDCYTAPCLIGGEFDTLSAYRIGGDVVGPNAPFSILAIGNSQPWFVSGFYAAKAEQAILADKRGMLDLGDMLYGESLAHVSAINGGFVEYLRGSRTRMYGSAYRHATALYTGSQVIAQSGSGTVPAASFETINTGSWPQFTHAFVYAYGAASVDLTLGIFTGNAVGVRQLGQDGGATRLPAGVLSGLI